MLAGEREVSHQFVGIGRQAGAEACKPYIPLAAEQEEQDLKNDHGEHDKPGDGPERHKQDHEQ